MDKNFRIRLGICFLLVALLGAGVLTRAALLMLVPSERLNLAMNRQFRSDAPKIPRRGYILDRNHEAIAVSMDVKSLYANPIKTQQKNKVAYWLSRILGLPYGTVRAKLNLEKGFVWIKRQLTEQEQSAVEELMEKHPTLSLSLGLAKESKRFYPNQRLASQVIGFTGLDANGLEGIERQYEKELSGSEGTKGSYDGRTLVVTLDKALQYTVEEELEKGLKETGGISATAIVLNSENGDILAMASAPSFNANRYSSARPEYRKIKAVTDTYEPGSTMKPILVAGALEQNIITPKTKVFCEYGKLQIGKHWVREAEAKDKWGWLRIGEVLQKSSNIGATKIGFMYGANNIFNWYKHMGFVDKTGIDLPGEATGYLAPLSKWSKIMESNVSFGQGISITPLQLARAYAAIANGGFLVTPRIVKSIQTFEGDFLRELPIGAKRRVMEKKTADTLATLLEGVVSEDGTAIKASVPGFQIIGKTGTAQKAALGKGYRGGKHVASFIGFAKGVKPNNVVLVIVDEPRFPYFGGEAAAPIFRRIMTAALAGAGAAPNSNYIPMKPLVEKNRVQDKVMSFASAAILPKELERTEGDWIMPDLRGVTAREALDLFSGKNIQLKVKGSGMVVEQMPIAGTKIKFGDLVSIRLERGVIFP